MHAIPAGAAYFHAQWRRAVTRPEHPEHVIVDGIAGRGAYVGTYLAWTSLSTRVPAVGRFLDTAATALEFIS